MTTCLSIPKIWNASEDYNKLFKLWEQICKSPLNEDFELDFKACNFLGHNGVAFLGGLAHLIQHRGGGVTFLWRTVAPNIKMNLAQNGFLYCFGGSQEPWDGNSVPYRSDCHHDKSEIMEYLLEKWLGKGWLNISTPLQDEIAGKVSEIYGNAFEHSDSQIGVFSCGQHYHKKNCLDLSVVDFGIGIAEKVRTLTENEKFSSEEALSWALAYGNSTVRDVSRGLGLNFLQEFIQCNKGTLRIFSNDGYVKIEDNKVIYKKQKINFSGTLIKITIRCDELYYCLDSEIWDADSISF